MSHHQSVYPGDEPQPLDESYWAALLREGEFASTTAPDYDLASEKAARKQTQPVITVVPVPVPLSPDWERIQEIMDTDSVVELVATGFNRGGLLVEWKSLQGFIPSSQLVAFQNPVRPPSLTPFVGQSFRLRVIECNPEQNRLIFSERAAQGENGSRASTLSRLHTDDLIEGVVTNLCDFGAFVDLGNIEGLIHISELSWGRVNHPADILQRGQQVRVRILDVDRLQARVALSLKRLTPDPWATVHERYKIGQLVRGTVTNVVDFGAFACIEEGLEGLIHVSELAEGHFLHPRNVINEGQVITARVMHIDPAARRLGLSLRLNEAQA